METEIGTEAKEKGKKSGCGYGCAVLIGVFLGIGGLIAVFAAALALGAGALGAWAEKAGMGRGAFLPGRGDAEESEYGEDEMPSLAEKWSSGQGEEKVVRIPLTGVILLDGGVGWRSGSAAFALRAIRRAACDPDVRGIILDINSGGGGVTASDILYHELKAFKAAGEDRRVVTIMGDVAASGAYYVALASDCIIARPTTLTGSIGVIMHAYNVKGLAEKLGVSDVTIKSGQNKDLLNPFGPVNPEHQKLLQRVIDEMHDRFASLVAENRKLPKDTVLPLADGRVFSAKDALANRLIDQIGYERDAREKMAALLGADDVQVFTYSEERGFFSLFNGPWSESRLDLPGLIRPQGARMMYIMDGEL